MKKILYILFAFSVILFLNGCINDTGNYDYTEVGDIKISGIEESYMKISYEDTLDITPVITTSYADKDMEYTWLLFDPNGKSNAIDDESYRPDTIGREKVLSYPVNLPEGTLTLTLKVRNKINNYLAYKSTTLNTGTLLSRGYYFLKETAEGRTELDLLLDNGSFNENLLKKSVGESMPGKASRLGLYMNSCFLDESTNAKIIGNAFAVISDNNVWTMAVSKMKRVSDFNSMFYHKGSRDEIPYYAVRGMWTAYFLTNKGVYANISQGPEFGITGTGKYGFTCKPEGGSKFAFYFNDGYSFVYYDEVHGNFMCCDYNGFAKAYKDGTYSPNNIKHKLLFLCPNYINKSQKCYAIFQDKDDAAKHYLYTMAFSGFSAANPITAISELGAGLKLNKATFAASNRKDARIIYFVADNKAYVYDIDKAEETQINLSGIQSNETITYIEHKYWTKKEDLDYNFNYLVVGTYNAGKYKVYMYNLLGGWPSGEPVKVSSGTGKVVDLQYVSPEYDGTDDQAYYPL